MTTELHYGTRVLHREAKPAALYFKVKLKIFSINLVVRTMKG